MYIGLKVFVMGVCVVCFAGRDGAFIIRASEAPTWQEIGETQRNNVLAQQQQQQLQQMRQP